MNFLFIGTYLCIEQTNSLVSNVKEYAFMCKARAPMRIKIWASLDDPFTVCELKSYTKMENVHMTLIIPKLVVPAMDTLKNLLLLTILVIFTHFFRSGSGIVGMSHLVQDVSFFGKTILKNKENIPSTLVKNMIHE